MRRVRLFSLRNDEGRSRRAARWITLETRGGSGNANRQSNGCGRGRHRKHLFRSEACSAWSSEKARALLRLAW